MSNLAGKGNNDPLWGAGAVSSMAVGPSLDWFPPMKQPVKVLNDAGGRNGDFPGNWFKSMAGRIRSTACNVEQNPCQA